MLRVNRSIKENNNLKGDMKMTKDIERAITALKEELKKLDVEVIEDALLTVENGTIRHNALKTAFQIFAFLMRQET